MPVHALRPLGEVNAERHQGEREALINALGQDGAPRQDGARRQDGAPRRLEDQLPALPFVPGCKSDNAARCGLDAGVLKGSLAEVARRLGPKTARCSQVAYTVAFVPLESEGKGARRVNLPRKLQPAPLGAEDCAFAFIYRGTKVNQDATEHARRWRLVEVDVDGLPWPMASHRRNSRVLKVLPHLFFTEPHVRASLYLDSESRLGSALNVSEAVREMLDGCGAGFAAQAHRTRSTQVLREFRAILDNGNTVEPAAVAEQEKHYRADAQYMHTLREGGGVGIDAELLVRRHDSKPTRQLAEAWMRAYLRGGDRDQPAFSYAFEKAAMAPCRRAAAADQTAARSCGLGCGEGFVNLVGHSASNDCTAAEAAVRNAAEPAAAEAAGLTRSSDFDRPAWSAAPPAWLCRAGSVAAAAAAADAKTSLLGHGAHASP